MSNPIKEGKLVLFAPMGEQHDQLKKSWCIMEVL